MDCLAETGLPLGGILALATLGLIAGLVVVVFARRSRWAKGAALGLLVVLVVGFASGAGGAPTAQAVSPGACNAAGGGGAAAHTSTSSTSTVTAPGSTTTATVTATPTPTPDGPIATTAPPDSPVIDLSIAASVSPPSVPSNVPTPVAISVVVDNPLAAKSSGPVTVKIPKLADAEAGGLVVRGFNWTLDDASDPANHVLTYGLAIPGFDHSSTLVMGYPGWKVRDALTVPATIVTGSAGDTNVLNNAASVTVKIN